MCYNYNRGDIMDYQVEDYGQGREYESVSSGMDNIYIPRDIPEDRRPSLYGNGIVKERTDNEEYSKEKSPRVMYSVLLRVYKDISTGQLYIEANTLFEISPGGLYDDAYRYSVGLIPISKELLLKLIKAYEASHEVHIDIVEIPIDLRNSYTYHNLDEFERESKDKENINDDDKQDALNNMLKEKIEKDDFSYNKKLDYK